MHTKAKIKLIRKRELKNKGPKIVACQCKRFKYTNNIAEENAKGGVGTHLAQLQSLTESQFKFSAIGRLKVKK